MSCLRALVELEVAIAIADVVNLHVLLRAAASLPALRAFAIETDVDGDLSTLAAYLDRFTCLRRLRLTCADWPCLSDRGKEAWEYLASSLVPATQLSKLELCLQADASGTGAWPHRSL